MWEWEGSLEAQVTQEEKGLALPWVVPSRGLGERPGHPEVHSIPRTVSVGETPPR